MRLTLRTMLAFMDDILEPAASEDLAKRIDESEFASNLMHHIRDVTRRLRLGAPKLHARGMGLDTNTVAEYLDNTMPSERVPDFEKVCLESDVHLAEVASSHQILAMVLGEPAEVPPGCRQRMYKLIHRMESREDIPVASEEARSPAVVAAVVADEARSRHRRLEVPDYLRSADRRRAWWPLAAGVAAILLVGMILFAAIDPLGMRRRVAEAPKQPSGAADDKAAATAKSTGEAAVAVVNEPTPSTKTGESAPVDDESAAPLAPSADATRVDSSTATDSAATVATEPVDQAAGDLRIAETLPSSDAATATPATDTAAPTPPIPSETPGLDSQPVATEPLGFDTAGAPAPAAGTSEIVAPPVAPAVHEVDSVGRLITDREVVVRYQNGIGWMRVPPQNTIFAGDRLQALAAYRPSIALASGVTLTMLGSSAVEFGSVDSTSIPSIELTRGRIILMTTGAPRSQVHLTVGGQHGTIIFGQADTRAGIELRRVPIEGSNPELVAVPAEIVLYCSAGEIRWVPTGSLDGTVLNAPGEMVLGQSGDALAGLAAPAVIPLWMERDERSAIEQRGCATLEQALLVDRPITLSLKEMAGDRRVEVCSVAVRSLGVIGEFNELVGLLSAVDQRASWTAQIEALREAMVQNLDTARLVREAFISRYGDRGPDLWRMLWGYTPDQLRGGEDINLVAALDIEELPLRVLAYWNLLRLTGQTYGYRPEHPAAQRRQAVLRWRQRLETSGIAPAVSG